MRRRHLRGWRRVCALLGAIAGLASAPTAAQSISATLNGAACAPYPPYTTTTSAPYQHWLYVRETAFCHVPMLGRMQPSSLLFVLFNVSVAGEGASARLCVHSGNFAVTCGPRRDLVRGFGVNWVAPPSPLPGSATGAFVAFSFPGAGASAILQYQPAWGVASP